MKEEEDRKESEKNLSISYDEFNKRTFYEDERGVEFHFNSDEDHIMDPDPKLNLHFSIPDYSSRAQALIFTIDYKKDHWLFIQYVTFLIDGKQYDVYGNFEKDTGNGEVYEWIVKDVDYSINHLLKAIMNGTSVKIRIYGK